MKKILLMLPFLFSYSVQADEALCKVVEPAKAIFEQKDKALHVYFTRCHPTLPLAFSNQSSDENPQPIMINMKTGEKTPFSIPKDHSAEDMVPSPDGKFLYVDLTDKIANKSKLGIYEIKEGKIVEKKIIEIENGGSYGYPSPAIREGKQMILGRRFSTRDRKTKPFLDTVDEKSGILKQGIELCSEHGLETLNYDADRPYISPDGEYFANAINNEMHVMKIRWDKVTPDSTTVPCDVVRKLPESASKVSFSPDNKKIAFHASEKEFLGRGIPDAYDPQSYLMDLESGETVLLSKPAKDTTSEFPYFCGDQGIIVREAFMPKNEKYSATFKLLPVPTMSSEKCPVTPETHDDISKFWEKLCFEVYPSKLKPIFDIQVTSKNCQELVKKWKKNKSRSQFKESEILAACKASSNK
jgi:WD40 repeat protein